MNTGTNGEDYSHSLHWYACYTRPRTEKTSLKKLLAAGYECYLPLQRTRRRWSDRWKWIDDPLFKSYIFVRVTHADFRPVLETGNLVKFISFEGKAVPIPDYQIETVKRLLNQDIELEVSDQRFSPGQQMEVVAGPLMGLTGELVEYRGTRKMLVRLGEIGQGLLVTIGAESLAPLAKPFNTSK